MADLTRLKARARKGTPPTPEVTNSNLKTPPREGQVKKTKIEFSVPSTWRTNFRRKPDSASGSRRGRKATFSSPCGRSTKPAKPDSRISMHPCAWSKCPSTRRAGEKPKIDPPGRSQRRFSGVVAPKRAARKPENAL